MKQTQQLSSEMMETQEQKKRSYKSVLAALMLSLSLLLAENSHAQTKDTSLINSPKGDQVKPEVKAPQGGVFYLQPGLDITNKSGTIRLTGGKKKGKFGAGGFLDLTSDPDGIDATSALGKLTLTTDLDEFIKGMKLAAEIGVNTQGPEALRLGFQYATKIKGRNVKCFLYPMINKNLSPEVGIFFDGKIIGKLDGSTFFRLDLMTKGFYGESQLNLEIMEDISLFLQARYGGKLGEKCKPSIVTGVSVKL